MRGAARFYLLFILICTLTAATTAFGENIGGFIENRGQMNPEVKYYAPGSRVAVYFTPNALVFDLHSAVASESAGIHSARFGVPDNTILQQGCAVYVRFEGANPSPVIESRGRLETQYNYFLGNDPSLWQTDVPAYEEVVYHGLWPGVDLVLSREGDRIVYELAGPLSADPTIVRFHYEGAADIAVRDDSVIVIETAAGTLTHEPAIPTLCAGFIKFGEKEPESLRGNPRVENRDNPSALLWSTFIGSTYSDHGQAILLDAEGNPIITGSTTGFDFPTTPGAYNTNWTGGGSIVVAKLSSTGSTLVWSTYLGGNSADHAGGLAFDQSGNIVLTGYTVSSNFPTTAGSFDSSFGGSGDAFVAKLSSTGSTLLWSTFLGHSGQDRGYAIAVDYADNVVLTGETASQWFPTTAGAYDTMYGAGRDVFVSKLSSTGTTLLWSTFIGADQDEWSSALVLDLGGNPVLTGTTTSDTFPVTWGSYDTSFDGDGEVFVASLSASGSSLIWNTFLGGNSYESGSALARDSYFGYVVAGVTTSQDFPTTPNAFDTSFNGEDEDIFVTKLNLSGNQVTWSTFLGGSALDNVLGLDLDSSGNPVLTGSTWSADFPTSPDSYDNSMNSLTDVFCAKLSNSGSVLLWGTYLGGSASQEGQAVAVDSADGIVLMGSTVSFDFPITPGAYDSELPWTEEYDIFLAKFGASGPTSVDGGLPGVCCLEQNNPNPFNPQTTIRYELPSDGFVKLDVFDSRGRRVRSLVGASVSAGEHEVIWRGEDDGGRQVASGVYYYVLQAAGDVRTRKLCILK